MRTSRKLLLLAGLTGIAMFGIHVSRANSEEQAQRQQQPAPPAPRPRLDVGKTIRIEPKLAGIVKNTTAQAPANPPVAVPPVAIPPAILNQLVQPRLDVGKGGAIEPRLQHAVQHAFGGQIGNFGGPNGNFGGQFGQPPAPPPAPPPAKPEFVNPKVEPGKVKWHNSFEEARAASLKSKKPVMLFQMMGKLDDQFC